jgi:hypothetical protein
LFWREIDGFILVINGHKPDLILAIEPVINDTQPAPTAFAASSVGPAQLAESAGTGYDVPQRWCIRQSVLKAALLLVVEVLRQVALKRGASMKLHEQILRR